MLNKSSEGPSRRLSEDGLVAHASMSGPGVYKSPWRQKERGSGQEARNLTGVNLNEEETRTLYDMCLWWAFRK